MQTNEDAIEAAFKSKVEAWRILEKLQDSGTGAEIKLAHASYKKAFAHWLEVSGVQGLWQARAAE